ncbi:MAG: ATP-binding cassette domain-containing protein [Methanosarcinales archaeon]|nr:ATP-binding cassette domain-containing protein [Methanosarcinales archaeon]
MQDRGASPDWKWSQGGMSFAMIEVKDLVKNYGEHTAVDGINFRVRKGEIFGFLGPNGAGKTTTLNILAGLSLPSSGVAVIAGQDVTKHPIGCKKRLGIATQDANFDHHLNIKDNLFYQGLLYGLSRKELKKRVDAALRWAKLEKYRKKRFHQLSGGMQRRLVVARAMLSNPEIILLDEPTTGLDPQSRRQVWEYIKDLKENGKTVLLTTHYMEEADILCDRISIIDHGRIIACGTPDELKKILNNNIVIDISLNAEVISEHVERDLNSISGVNYVKIRNHGIRIGVGDDAVVEQVLISIIAKNKINGINIIHPSLEDVFLHLTGREMR